LEGKTSKKVAINLTDKSNCHVNTWLLKADTLIDI